MISKNQPRKTRNSAILKLWKNGKICPLYRSKGRFSHKENRTALRCHQASAGRLFVSVFCMSVCMSSCVFMPFAGASSSALYHAAALESRGRIAPIFINNGAAPQTPKECSAGFVQSIEIKISTLDTNSSS